MERTTGRIPRPNKLLSFVWLTVIRSEANNIVLSYQVDDVKSNRYIFYSILYWKIEPLRATVRVRVVWKN